MNNANEGAASMIHPAFPAIDIPDAILAAGFTAEHVNGNDACVRLVRNDWTLWIEHEDVSLREFDTAQFVLYQHDADMDCRDGEWLEFVTLPELLAYLEARA
jgi:hypothetical protein